MKTAEDYSLEIYPFPSKESDKFPSDLQKSVIIGYNYASQFKVKAEGVSDEEIEKAVSEYINKNKQYFGNSLVTSHVRLTYIDAFKDCRNRMLSLLDEKEKEIEGWKDSYNQATRFCGTIEKEYKTEILSLQAELEAVKKDKRRLSENYSIACSREVRETKLKIEILKENKELKSQAEKMAEAIDKLINGTFLTLEQSRVIYGEFHKILSHYKLTVPTDIKK